MKSGIASWHWTRAPVATVDDHLLRGSRFSASFQLCQNRSMKVPAPSFNLRRFQKDAVTGLVLTNPLPLLVHIGICRMSPRHPARPSPTHPWICSCHHHAHPHQTRWPAPVFQGHRPQATGISSHLKSEHRLFSETDQGATSYLGGILAGHFQGSHGDVRSAEDHRAFHGVPRG